MCATDYFRFRRGRKREREREEFEGEIGTTQESNTSFRRTFTASRVHRKMSAARMFASRGERQGSSFLREIASLTVERRGRNWPRVGQRPQASASFSFLQRSRWTIDYRASRSLFLSNRPPWSLVSSLHLSSPASASHTSLPPLNDCVSAVPLLLPSQVDTTVVAIAVAAFSAVYAATLLVYAVFTCDVGGIQPRHAIAALSRGKKEREFW